MFKDHPDSYVVNGVSWVGEPKLTPWLHAPGFVACVSTDGSGKATGVVMTKKQLDELGGLGKGLGNNLTWFLKEQKKLFSFDEGVFVFMLSLGLIIPATLIPMLWVFAVSQLLLGIIRCCQRGQQLASDQRPDPPKTPDK